MSDSRVMFVFALMWFLCCASLGGQYRANSFSRKKRLKRAMMLARGIGGALAACLCLTALTTGLDREKLLSMLPVSSVLVAGVMLAVAITLWRDRRLLPNEKPGDDPARRTICVVAIDDDIDGGGQFGNGFFISEDLVVTVFHILKVLGRYGVHTMNGPFPFEVVALDPENDLMLLKVEEMRSPHTSLPLAAREDEVHPGNQVRRIGYTSQGKEDLRWESQDGCVLWKGPASLLEEPEARAYDPRWKSGRQVITAELQSQKGNSGSPILRGGKVVGVLTNGKDNRIVFSPVRAIHELLDQAGISLNDKT